MSDKESRIDGIANADLDEDCIRGLERLLFMARNGKVGALALIALDHQGGLLQLTKGVKEHPVALIGAIELMKRDVMGLAPAVCPCEFDEEFHN